MKIKFISDFARNWKAGDIVDAIDLHDGTTLVANVACIDTALLMEHCEVVAESEEEMTDILTVSFDNGLKDESALCVTQKQGERTIVLKMELGEQADILYRLLTEQMSKAVIKDKK